MEGKSIFLTGAAGSGKTYVLEQVIAALRQKYVNGVHVTASTGVVCPAPLKHNVIVAFDALGLLMGWSSPGQELELELHWCSRYHGSKVLYSYSISGSRLARLFAFLPCEAMLTQSKLPVKHVLLLTMACLGALSNVCSTPMMMHETL